MDKKLINKIGLLPCPYEVENRIIIKHNRFFDELNIIREGLPVGYEIIGRGWEPIFNDFEAEIKYGALITGNEDSPTFYLIGNGKSSDYLKQFAIFNLDRGLKIQNGCKLIRVIETRGIKPLYSSSN